MKSPEKLQQEFYARTAVTYDAAQVHAEDEHSQALGHIVMFARERKLSSFLDVGCGTGRGICRLSRELAPIRLCGVDLSAEMLREGRKKNVSGAALVQCDSYRLPFENNSFDAVCELGLLHHVEHPHRVVAEMCRVAARAVFLSDHNRYGQGSLPERLTKLALKCAGLIDPVYYLRTGGKGYGVSEGDGISYSYSVFDSYPVLERWAGQILAIPIRGSSLYPKLTAVHLLVAAFRNTCPAET